MTILYIYATTALLLLLCNVKGFFMSLSKQTPFNVSNEAPAGYYYNYSLDFFFFFLVFFLFLNSFPTVVDNVV